jgi:hypothetical protein
MRWAAAVEEAARNRGELTTPEGHQRAMRGSW